MPALPTGCSNIDSSFGGIPAPGLTAVAAYSSLGVSQLLWNIASGLDLPLLYFGDRPIDARRSSVNTCLGFFHDDGPHDDLGVIVGLIHEAHRRLGIKAVFIDDMERYVGVRYSSRRSKLRRSFLRLPEELGIALVAGYSVTDRASDDRRARWSDLRGTVLEDPDLLMLLHPESDVPRIAALHAIRQDGHSPIVTERVYLPS